MKNILIAIILGLIITFLVSLIIREQTGGYSFPCPEGAICIQGSLSCQMDAGFPIKSTWFCDESNLFGFIFNYGFLFNFIIWSFVSYMCLWGIKSIRNKRTEL